MSEKPFEILEQEFDELRATLAARTAKLDQVEKALDDHQTALRKLAAQRLERSAHAERYSRMLLISTCLFASVVVVIAAAPLGLLLPVSLIGAVAVVGRFSNAQGFWWRHPSDAVHGLSDASLPAGSATRLASDPTENEPATAVPVADLAAYRSARYVECEAAPIPIADVVARLACSSISINTKLEVMAMAAEPLLDPDNGDPMVVYKVANALAKEWRYYETTCQTSATERMRRRVQISVLRARAMHCVGDSSQALAECLAALVAIEDFGGGREAVLHQLASPHKNIAAECVVAVSGILAASVRRAVPDGHAVRQHMTSELRDIVDSYIPWPHPEDSVIYPGTRLMVQVLYLLADEQDPSDAPRIEALRQLDSLLRATDRRAQATVPLREMALERWSKRLRASDDEGLHRHMEAVGDAATESWVPCFANGMWR